MDNKETFQYTYAAKEQAEVESIRKKYLPQEESKLEQLRRLDRSASQKAQTCALSLGIVGTLILGTGMSLAMTDLAKHLGMAENFAMLVGVLVGVIGLVLVALAYPVYNRVLIRERKRIAPQILQLTEDLLQ